MRKTNPGALAALLLLIGFSGSRAEQSYLVRVFFESHDQLSRIEFPVYAYFDEYVIAEANQEELALTGLPYEVLDKEPWSQPYWLVSALPEEFLEMEGAEPLFVDQEIALLKMEEEEGRELAKEGYEMVKLHRVPLPPRGRPPLMPAGVPADPFIETLVAQVSDSTLTSYLQRLEDFRTRYSYTDSCWAGGQWLYDQFYSYGLDVEFDYYTYGGETWRNVVATLPGTVDSTRIYIICGHFDSISEDPWFNAPGADDNASGTALVLEAARILSQYPFDYTARFICFSGEEQGLIGSHHYAALAGSLGMNIGGVLNFDMVAYCDDSLFDFAVLSDQNSRPLLHLLMSAADMYAALDPYDPERNSAASDHFWFQQYGYRAIFAIELGRTHGNPYYHSSGDLVSTLTIPFEREMTKAGVASLASLLADYPMPPAGLTVVDAGTGDALNLAWAPNSEPDLAGYLLYYGTSSRQYGIPVPVGSDTTFVLTGLSEGVRYYLALTARDTLDHESPYSVEKSAVPYAVPLPPQGLAAIPLNRAVQLDWSPNLEGDLSGYNVYRSMTSGGGYAVINPSVVTDTTYLDTLSLADTIYYYVVTALDSLSNESGYSDEVSCWPMFFDSGILLVDETTNGPGDPYFPNDEQVDSFYHNMLQGYHYTDWENSDGSNPPGLLDVGHYSSIVWHSDDYFHQYLPTDTLVLRSYLRAGGNLWLVGFRNLKSLGSPYPGFYSPGDLPYDCFHLSWASEQYEKDFLGATGVLGYPSVDVESLKTLPAWEGKLPNVNILIPRDSETIYTFNSASGDTAYQDHPCGARWLGGDHKVVFLGFPLWCMDEGQARLVAQEVMDDFGEAVGIEEQPRCQIPDPRSQMFQNYPNPFSSSTTIRYSLPSAVSGRLTAVDLSVYDLAGRLVRTLVDGPQETGFYSVVWDGRDSSGRSVASGVYFYRLSATNTADRSATNTARHKHGGQAGRPATHTAGRRAGGNVDTWKSGFAISKKLSILR